MSPSRRRPRRAAGALACALAAAVAAGSGAPAAAGSAPATAAAGSAAATAAGASAAAGGDPVRARAEAAALRARVQDLARQVAESTATYEAARHDLGVAAAEQVRAERELQSARQAEAAERDGLRSRVRALYTSGGSVAIVAGVVGGQGPGDLVGRATLVQRLVEEDRDAVRTSQQARQRAEQAQRATQDGARRELAVSAAVGLESVRLEGLLAEQNRLLAEADAEVRRIVEAQQAAEAAARQEAQRRAAALRADTPVGSPAGGALPPATAGVPGGTGQLPGSGYGGSSSDSRRVYAPGTTSGLACPVGAAHSFVDTWLAPRSGGRRHQGTDVFAPLGSTAYAVVDGVVDKVGNGGLGGITLWIRSDTGDRFYYAHNSANLVGLGDRVRAGDPVARVGKTGNAATTPPHVHFEAHPDGGAAANPYPLLKALCG